MKKCKTCEEINFWKNNHSLSNVFEDKLYSKISVYTFKKGIKKIPANAKGVITTRAFNLNYCPTCGRKVGSNNE